MADETPLGQENFKYLARKRLGWLSFYFALSTGLLVAAENIRFHWVGEIISLVPAFTTIYMGFVLWSWFSEYQNALRDSHTQGKAYMLTVWNGVVGSIHWK